MDLHGASVFLVIIILAGLVAAGGDRIGRIAAKRRLHFMGLRPRLAASWIAVFTGVLIALGTFSALAIASRTVREMLFHYDELKADLKELDERVDVLGSEIGSLEKQRNRVTEELNETLRIVEERGREVDSLTQTIASNNERLTFLRSELNETSSALMSAKNQLKESERRLEDVRFDLKQAEDTNAKLREEGKLLKEENRRLEETRKQLFSAAKELEEKVMALREGQIRLLVNQPLLYVRLPSELNLPQVREVILNALKELETNLRGRGLELEKLSSEEFNELLNSLSMVSQDVILIIYSAKNVLPGENVELDFEIAIYRLIFRQGEVIASVTIPPDIKGKDLPKILPAILRVIRGIAIDRRLLPDIATGEVGTLASNDVDKLRGLLDKTSGTRKLEIISGKDTYTTDRLDEFVFKVYPLEGGGSSDASG